MDILEEKVLLGKKQYKYKVGVSKIKDRFEDLTGKKFRDLLVIKFKNKDVYIDSKGYKRYKYYWYCKTSDGKIITRSSSSLRDSIRFPTNKDTAIFSGKKIGKLTVIKRVEEKKWSDDKGRKRKNVYWLCKCDCGNEVLRTEHSLKEERTRSCGCNKINNKNKEKDNQQELE